MSKVYKKSSFEDFSKGKFGNGGQNIYCSKKGTLQRIFNYDVTNTGYPDIPVASSHGMNERPPLRIMKETENGFSEYFLPSEGSYEAIVFGLCDDGYDDLIIACQMNGTHTDTCGIIYHGGPDGLSVDRREELPAADALAVAAGRFSGKKPEICFICSKNLIIYKQENGSFNMILFEKMDLQAVSGVAGDFDGDGYDDLYLRLADGRLVILWGSDKGLSLENMTVFANTDPEPAAAVGTTATRRSHSKMWRCAVTDMDGQQCLFVGGKSARFYTFGKDRSVKLKKELNINNAIHAVSGELQSESDLAILCSESVDDYTDSYFFAGGNTDIEPIKFKTRAALTGTFAKLKRGPVLCVAQGKNSETATVGQQFISFESGKPEVVYSFDAFEPSRILSGKFNGKDVDLACIDHEAGGFLGREMTQVYLGGDWEYGTEHMIELPGSAAVDMHLVDLNDDGKTDVYITNCSENDPVGDPGSFIYWQDENGFSPENRLILPTVRSHGSAIGDFRHSGYLDIATGGICNREIRIYRGGPDGYDPERYDRLILGPQTENYKPSIGNVFSDDSIWPEGEKDLAWTYGEVRWLFTADLNNDGWLDLIVPCHSLPYSIVYFGGPDGFTPRRSQKFNIPGAINCTVADLNKNGFPDLIFSHHYIATKTAQYETYLTIYWGGPDGYKESCKTMLPTHCANAVTAGDFNGNGWLDLYATCYNNGRSRDLLSYVFVNDHGHFDYRNSYPLYNHSGSGCIAGDFNGDGYCDLVIASHKEFGNHQTKSVLFYGGPDGLKQDNCTLLPSVGPHGLSTVHPGNLLDKGPKEFYESEVMEVPDGCCGAKLTAEFETLGKGYLEISWKFADSEEGLENAAWSEPVENGREIKLPAGTSFAAYRLALCAYCSAGNVRVSEVTAEFI